MDPKKQDNRGKEISRNLLSRLREIMTQQNTSSTGKDSTLDNSLKRKLSTDETTPQSVKHRKHSDEEGKSSSNQSVQVVAKTGDPASIHLEEEEASDEATSGNDLEKIFESFQELEVYFNDITRPMNSNYREHVLNYLCNNYQFMFKSDLKRVCKKYNFHLMPTLKELYSVGTESRNSKRQLLDMPQPSDKVFYLELKYIRLRENIDTCDQSEINEVLEQFSDIIKSLTTCDCCFGEDFSPNDMFPCVDGHDFCKACIRQLVKVNIGLGTFRFRCMNGYCEKEFSLYTLQEALELNVFSSLVSEVKMKKVEIAGITDAVKCPSCQTYMVTTDRSALLLNCINPRCLKAICGLCKQLNHSPKKCTLR